MFNVVRRDFFVGTLAGAVVLCGFCASASAEKSWAEKMFKVQSHDFRTVGRGTKSVFHFEMTNPYEEDVHIAAVRTSCGCTTPTLTKKSLKTHEKGAVVATFNTSTHIGQKAATLTVVFDKPYYEEVQLKVSGFIRTDITFEPDEIAFGEFAAGETREREVVITHRGKSDWKITDVRSHCTNLQVRLNPAERGAGIVRYRMSVRLDDQMPVGEFRNRLTLISNDRDFPTTEMAISGRVRPLVTVSPASVALGTLSFGGMAEKRLVVRGDQPFEIRDVVCADDRFEFEVPTGSKKVHFVKVRFTADDAAAKVAQEIRIVTDLPGKNWGSCVVTGTVQAAP